MQTIQTSLAALPGRGFAEALAIAATHRITEPLLGTLALDHVQACPQNAGVLDEDTIDQMRAISPNTQIRLHANVRCESRRQIIDLCQFEEASSYWQRLAALSRYANAPAYSAHAGQRKYATLAQTIENTRRAADLFQCPVALEGQYPTPNDLFLVSNWEEYATVLDSGIPMAIDLSHLNIVAHKTRRWEENLVRELLASENTIEIHVSDNDGSRDAHQPLAAAPSWWPLLAHANPNAVIFSEGQQGHAH